MATALQVIEMLIPQGGWVIAGEEYEGIQFIDCAPISKKEFQDGFAKFDAWKASQEASKSKAREEILAKLGLTADEVASLLA